MITKIDGSVFLELMYSGIKYLDIHRDTLNDLNVFPVPDGDTGTNMSMTLKCGYAAANNTKSTLSEVSQVFSSAAVFGARGNSGVILSQFIKGLSEEFKGHDYADSTLLSRALANGCSYAYASVAKPMEGTMLTVIKDASNYLASSLPLASIDEAIDAFIYEAKRSLSRTPDLLPILKKAGVVDSGGAGIVYFFEGMKKYLLGEDIELSESISTNAPLDLSRFNKNTSFDYGYCVEGLIQLKMDVIDFDLEMFKKKISKLGNSIVASLERDKLKLHIHTKDLGRLMTFTQETGEFLTVKIDNMTVQNFQKQNEDTEQHKFLYSEEPSPSEFAVVAVAANPKMQKRFYDMGADVVILSDISPSSQDFLDAFGYTTARKILVFPNSSNSLLTSMQAASMYKKAKVFVLNSRSSVECFSALPLIDFDGDIDDAISTVNDTLSNLYQLSVYHALKDIKYGNKHISKDEFFVLSGNKILNIDTTLNDVTLKTVKQTLNKNDYSVVTVFYGDSIEDDYISILYEAIRALGFDIEIVFVPTYETVYSLSMTFE